jgi:hypothetical protein
MKEIIKERTKVEKYTVYQAVDGTEFDFKEDCERYDNSAQGVLRGKLKSLIVNDEWNGWDLMGGNEDNQVIAVAVPHESDIDIILQNYYCDHPWILQDSNVAMKEKLVAAVNQAYKDQDVILFGINCDGDYYFINSRQNIIDNLNVLKQEII